ncbi:hypothetical protein [Natrialba hulunbeirensis]|uniref:hypothetical protein n=1 Tax=Natrialba hulunbeirensis TaxID=123783 RepID=UPI0012692AE0|nr:hypothetical protein [Natrialba hulunbeirensis]
MADCINQKLRRMGRRRFLSTVAGLGVSGAALNFLTKDAVASVDLDDEVPRLSKLRHTNHEAVLRREEKPQREPIFYTIPRDEWAVVETAHDAAAQVNSLLEAEGASDGVTAGVTTVTRGHHSQKAVIVKRTVNRGEEETIEPTPSKEKLRGMLPDTISGTAGDGNYRRTIDGIPITIETEQLSLSSQTQDTSSGPGNYYNHEYRPVPGGSVLQWGDAASFQYGSGGTPVHDGSNNDYNLVTAGHVIKDEDMYQPATDDDQHIGSRMDDKHDDPGTPEPAFDAGVIDLDTDTYHQFAGASGDDTYWDDVHIFGIVGRDELVDNENSDYSLRRRGARTGMESGTLNEVYDDHHAFDTSADEDDGDSGGPHFMREYNSGLGIYEAYIAGIHYAGNTKMSRATMMSAIESEYSVAV